MLDSSSSDAPAQPKTSHGSQLETLISQFSSLVDNDQLARSESADAKRLAIIFQDRIGYCPELSCWFVYDGARWEQCSDTGRISELALKSTRVLRLMSEQLAQALRPLVAEAIALQEKSAKSRGKVPAPELDPEQERLVSLLFLAEEMASWAREGESARRRQATVSLAQTESSLRVKHEQFDADPWTFACTNGVLDLRTGHFVPHDPAQRITKLAGVAYDATAECPRWLQLMQESHAGDSAKIDYLQRLYGYTLSGENREHKLFYHMGLKGREGKGLALQTIARAMGDYAVVLNEKELLLSRNDRHPAGIMKLRAARMALVGELPERASFNVNLIKNITAGDPIEARGMHKAPVDFVPFAKLHMSANHAVTLHDDDNAFFARLVKIPYTVSFEGREDRTLKETLAAELPGILNWLVAGCRAWLVKGLDVDVPACLVQAKADYRRDQNTIGQWLDECTIQGGEMSRKAARASYETWCRCEGETQPMPPKLFCAALRKAGLSEPAVRSDERKWIGRSVKPDAWAVAANDGAARAPTPEQKIAAQMAQVLPFAIPAGA